jgi:predicted deacylase
MTAAGGGTFTIADLAVAPGQIGFGGFTAAYLQDSSPVRIPLIVVNGAEEGPVLWLDSTMHGPEIVGAEVIRRLTREVLDPARLRGVVIAAPILNPLAFLAHAYHTPQDNYNLNRVFPGNPRGLLSQRLAHLIMTEGIARADYVINMHCNPLPALMFNLVHAAGDETSRRAQDMADAFGITTINMVVGYEPHRTGTIADSAMAAGKPTIVVELIAWRRLDEDGVRAGLRGTLNVMRRIGMLDGAEEPQTGVQVLPGRLTRTEVTVDKGGLISFTKELGDPIRQGEVIALLRDPYGDVVEEVRSPVDGWILAYPSMHNQAAATGDFAAFLAFPHDGKPLT